MNLNKGILTPVVILLVIIIVGIAGVGVWQFTATKKEPEPKEEQNGKSNWNCGDKINYKGQDYSTVKIGEQCWFGENLNVGSMIKGTQEQGDNGTIEKFCYNRKKENCDIYGGLYQWGEAMQYNSKEGAQGICPEGWHIPSDSEFCTLERQVCQDLGYEGCNSTFGCYVEESKNFREIRGHDEGSALAADSELWGGAAIQENENLDSSGFRLLPSGSLTGGSFLYKGNSAILWSSSFNTGPNQPSDVVWNRTLHKWSSKIARYDDLKKQGFSVRCLKD